MVKQNATPDSSFWINAHRTGLLPFVLERFRLYYAPMVGQELRMEFASGREFWRLVREGMVIEARPVLDEVREFGAGERAVLNLALEHWEWSVLMDDRKPFLEAQRLGLKAICTPALVVWLYAHGHMSDSRAMVALTALQDMGTISPNLLDVALAQLSTIWKRPERS